jgi:ribosomal protein L4
MSFFKSSEEKEIARELKRKTELELRKATFLRRYENMLNLSLGITKYSQSQLPSYWTKLKDYEKVKWVDMFLTKEAVKEFYEDFYR